MKKVEIPMFLFRKPDGTETLGQHDHTKNGTDQYWLDQMGACMGRVVVVGEYEDIEGDPREKLIEGLEKAVEKERVDSHVRVNALLEKISQLKCLTHDTTDQ
ncbi:hypothetical protein 8P_047 [Pseudomonas phage 8P]|nr:hypothetical protein 8P_047 [Pseudomonas phage 8P]